MPTPVFVPPSGRDRRILSWSVFLLALVLIALAGALAAAVFAGVDATGWAPGATATFTRS